MGIRSIALALGALLLWPRVAARIAVNPRHIGKDMAQMAFICLFGVISAAGIFLIALPLEHDIPIHFLFFGWAYALALYLLIGLALGRDLKRLEERARKYSLFGSLPSD